MGWQINARYFTVNLPEEKSNLCCTDINTKKSEFKCRLWIMQGKHVRSDIHLLSKTTIYVHDGIMDAYFMLLIFKSLFQLLSRKGCEIDVFLTRWLEHIFSNRELYIVQQDNNQTFLAQVLHCINQVVHLKTTEILLSNKLLYKITTHHQNNLPIYLEG